MQVKTRLFLICSCLISILFGLEIGKIVERNNYIIANEESQSEIAEIESVIDEQPTQIILITIQKEKEEVEIPILRNNEIVSLYGQSNVYRELINSLTEEDKELICRIVFLECGNQCELGQRAVIEVILNRVLNEKYPDTVYGVLSAPGQFSTWGLRNTVSQENIDKMMEILEIVYEEDEIVLTTDYVYFARGTFSFADPDNNIQIQDHWFGTR